MWRWPWKERFHEWLRLIFFSTTESIDAVLNGVDHHPSLMEMAHWRSSESDHWSRASSRNRRTHTRKWYQPSIFYIKGGREGVSETRAWIDEFLANCKTRSFLPCFDMHMCGLRGLFTFLVVMVFCLLTMPNCSINH